MVYSMSTILVLIAVVFFIMAILTGTNIIKVRSEWASVALAYGFLAIGGGIFGIVLTLS